MQNNKEIQPQRLIDSLVSITTNPQLIPQLICKVGVQGWGRGGRCAPSCQWVKTGFALEEAPLIKRLTYGD